MSAPEPSLDDLLAATLRRFLRQNGEEADADTLRAVARRLHALVDELGLPEPVASEIESDRIRLPDSEQARRAALAIPEGASPLVADAVRQLVKALFYPELRQCRLSFKAVAADGSCRRQDLERARHRISGCHCVDCPHWRDLSPEAHPAFLARQWHAGPGAFAAHAAIFLPEDFRALRRWIAAHRNVRP